MCGAVPESEPTSVRISLAESCCAVQSQQNESRVRMMTHMGRKTFHGADTGLVALKGSGSHSMSWCWVCWGFCVQFVSSSEQKRWIRWFWWREQTGNGCIYCFMVSGIWSVMDPWDKRPFLIFCNEILWIFSEYLAIVYLFYTKVLLFSINLLFKRSLTQVAAWFHDFMISWFQHVIYSKCMWKNKVI